MPSATFLHGVRTRWADAPVEVRRRVLAHTGSLTAEPRDCQGGMATGVAAVLTGTEATVFVKAVDAVDNPPGAEMYRTEARLAGRLPAHPRIPGLIDSGTVPVAAGEWELNLFEARPGRPPTHPWRSGDLDRVLDAWSDLRPVVRATAWPQSGALSDFFTAWRAIADDQDDPWHDRARHWVGRETAMAGLVDGGATAVLSHIDLRADNILVGESADEVAFVDWAHPGTAAPWADVALLLADVVASGAALENAGETGGIDVLGAFARLEPGTDPELAVALISGLGAFLHRRAVRETTRPAMPHRQVWSLAASEQISRFIEAHTR